MIDSRRRVGRGRKSGGHTILVLDGRRAPANPSHAFRVLVKGDAEDLRERLSTGQV